MSKNIKQNIALSMVVILLLPFGIKLFDSFFHKHYHSHHYKHCDSPHICQISGTVSDQSNKPLTGVSVFLTELHKGTTTDKNGEYTLTGIPKGSLKIQFSRIGYKTVFKGETI